VLAALVEVVEVAVVVEEQEEEVKALPEDGGVHFSAIGSATQLISPPLLFFEARWKERPLRPSP